MNVIAYVIVSKDFLDIITIGNDLYVWNLYSTEEAAIQESNDNAVYEVSLESEYVVEFLKHASTSVKFKNVVAQVVRKIK